MVNKASTLAELQRAKEDWLKLAKDQDRFQAAIDVACILGERVEHMLPSGNNRDLAWKWKSGAVTITVSSRRGKYLLTRKEYKQIFSVSVLVGNHRVVWGQVSNDNVHVCQDEVFIPGKWVKVLERAHEVAMKLIANQERTAQENQRQRLLSELLVGIQV